MGNDGGSIPTRRELVKSASRAPTLSELKATILESLAHAWAHDPLSNLPLDFASDDGAGVASDWRGRLYNYAAVLEALAEAAREGDGDGDDGDEAGSGEAVSFLREAGVASLRDIVRLKFTTRSGEGSKRRDAIVLCPLSQKELGPNCKAVYLVPCGHVFSEAASREFLRSTSAEGDDTTTTPCPECSTPFQPADDVIPLLSTDEKELAKLAARRDHLKADGRTHSGKKEKRDKKKRKAGEVAADGEGEETSKRNKRRERDGKEKKSSAKRRVEESGINNPMAASLTAKVLAEQDERSKRRKMAAAAH